MKRKAILNIFIFFMDLSYDIILFITNKSLKMIIFNFHHALVDFPSMNLFIDDLNQVYTIDQLLHSDENALTYLDRK
jgi:hypothetical protein